MSQLEAEALRYTDMKYSHLQQGLADIKAAVLYSTHIFPGSKLH